MGELGNSFVKLIIEEGYPLSYCRSITLFSLLIFLDMMSKMNFTVIYTFNYFNKQFSFIKCEELNDSSLITIKIISQIIGYSQELAPFSQVLLLIIVFQFIGASDGDGAGGEGDQEYGDELGDDISQTGFSEYLVKGTVTSYNQFAKDPKASKQKTKEPQAWETPKGMRKKLNSRVAGLDTLSMH